MSHALRTEVPTGGTPTLSLLPPNATEQLLSVVEQLSLARDMPTLVDIVRRAARVLTGADGATFVLRDGDFCYYVDEDAIAPLWKGKRFPLETCVSGWAMLNCEPAIIPDIYEDARIPIEAYRPTFVRSLVMVPIRTASPIGAIGNYWSQKRVPTPQEVRLLRALADSTSIAMENVQLYESLEKRVRDRTEQLEDANRQLESFAQAVAHELKQPLNQIAGFASVVAESPALPEPLRTHVTHIQKGARRLDRIVEDLLWSARTALQPLRSEHLDLGDLAREAWRELAGREPNRHVDVTIAEGMLAQGDRSLLLVVLLNLLGNARKYSRDTQAPRVEMGATNEGGVRTFFVRDNGCGFDAKSDRLFQPFQRLHTGGDIEGTGVGLSTVRQLVQKHGGRIWAESAPGQGATFRFTLDAA